MTVEQVAPGVSRLVLPLGLFGVETANVYLLDDPDGPVLVDCGASTPGALDVLADRVAGAGSSLDDLRALIVTHPHVDHYGLAGAVADRTGAEVWMHPAAHLDFLAWRDPAGERRRLRRVLAGHGVDDEDVEALVDAIATEWSPYLSSIVEPNRPLWGGDQITIGGRTWDVLHTPGHSRAHVCLWSPADRLLISGDHVLPVIAPPINFHHGFDDDPLGQYLDGLATVVELDPALVLPGHGPPLRDGARRAEAISRAKRRRIAATLGSLDAGPASVREITDRCFTGVSDHQHVRLAMTEALAHLAYLRKRGMVLKAAGSDGIVRFERRPAAELASC